MSVRQSYFRELMLEVKAVSRGAPHSSQALTEKIMAQHVKLLNALSPSDKQGWDTMAADLSRKHIRNIEQDVRHDVDTINLVKSRSRAERWLDAVCQHDSFGM